MKREVWNPRLCPVHRTYSSANPEPCRSATKEIRKDASSAPYSSNIRRMPFRPRSSMRRAEGLVAERSLVKTLQPTKEELCVPPQRSLGVMILRVVRRTLLQVLSRAQELGLNIIHGEPCVLVELGYYAPGGLGSSDGGGDP